MIQDFKNVLELEKEYKYKDLCTLLNEEEKGRGNSRDAQLSNWKRYFDFYKPNPRGQKFKIIKFHDTPKQKIDNRKGNSGRSKGSRKNNTIEYTKNIENLILNLLMQGGDLGFGKVFLSKNVLLKELNMVNDNYAYCKQRIPKLSQFMNIHKDTVTEWYDSTSNMLERNLEVALKSLEKQSLILWSREITVAEAKPIAEMSETGGIVKTTMTDRWGDEITNYAYKVHDGVILYHREGTDNEKKFIIRTEREILKEMKYKNKSEVILNSKWNYFIERVNEIILKEFGIAFYYKSYKILFNEEHVLEAIEDISEFELNKLEKEKEQNLLNRSISDRINFNAIKRHKKSKKEIDKSINISGKELRRSSKIYTEHNNQLSNSLIKNKAKNIKYEVKHIDLNTLTKEEEKLVDKMVSL